MIRLDHIAFLVNDLEAACTRVEELGIEAEEACEFEAEGTRESYAGRLLLVQPIGPGPYADALEARGPGLHHVALNVPDLEAFMGDCEGSGWLMHPASFATSRSSRTVWLARPGVEGLVEVHESKHGREGAIDHVVLAGLDLRPGLSGIFGSADIRPGPTSGVVIDSRFIGSPEHLGALTPEVSDVHEYNRRAWNRNVERGSRWTVAVTPAEVSRAREGHVEIMLTSSKFVPREWLGELEAKDVLCLASGGGQQGPILAAAKANVTVFDASEAQLARDREVAEREDLELVCVRGDMRDLSAFDDESFDLIVNPVSIVFVDDVVSVWRECARVLKPGGELLSGYNNPVSYCFDWGSVERGSPIVRHRLPYRDIDHLEDPFLARALADGDPVEFSHTLEELLGAQADAGLAIVGLYTDPWGDGQFPDPYFDAFIATRARKIG